MSLTLLKFWREGLIALLLAGLLWYRGSAADEGRRADAATSAYSHLAELVKDQNLAIQGWEAEAKDRRKQAQIALERAARDGQARLDRAVEFERSMAALVPSSDCPAGEAVGEIRAALRKATVK